MVRELYIEYRVTVERNLRIPIEEGDPTPNRRLAEDALRRKYPEATATKIHSIIERDQAVQVERS